MKNTLYIILLFISVRLSSQCTYSVVASYTAPSCSTCCDGIIAAGVQGAYCTSTSPATLQPIGMITPNWVYPNLCAGSYTIQVIDGCACLAICGVALPSGPTSIAQISYTNNDFIIYPNPVSDILHIDSELYFESGIQIEILNTLGQIILKLPFKNEIDVSQLSRGCYFLNITNTEQQQFHSKFTKE